MQILLHLARLALTLPNLHKEINHAADHPVEKSVCGHIHCKVVICVLPAYPVNRANCAASGSGRGTESGKIVLPRENAGG